MGILEKEVWVKLSSANIKFYEEKGYHIPRYKHKQGRMMVKRGTSILVDINHLQMGSHVHVTKICDDCGKHTESQLYQSILKNRVNEKKDRCVECSVSNKPSKKKNIIKDQNKTIHKRSLEFYAKTNNKEYLLKEFSDKNIKRPNEIFKSSEVEYLWNCSDCDSEYPMKMCNRTNSGSNCPYCTGKKINHTNCLATVYPEIAKLLNNKERGYKITTGINKKEEFLCVNCGYVDSKSVTQVIRQGFSCPRCSDGISYPEKFMFSVLDQLNIQFERQVSFEWSKTNNQEIKRYDFYIPSLNCIIETHGDQHYKGGFETLGGNSENEEKRNDILKKNIAINNEIDYYIVVDCRKSNMNFIKNNVLNSIISQLFNLEKIDWLKCHEYACNSIVKIACEMWNDKNISTIELGSILKLHQSTIIRYLKQGTLLNWCEYNPKEELEKSRLKNSLKKRKRVVQLSLNGGFIKEWDSIKNAAKELISPNATAITYVCKGKYSQSGGYKWMYKEDYEKYIEQQNTYSDEMVLS